MFCNSAAVMLGHVTITEYITAGINNRLDLRALPKHSSIILTANNSVHRLNYFPSYSHKLQFRQYCPRVLLIPTAKMLFFTAITTLALLLNPSAAAPAPEPAAVIQASEPVNATSGISVRATEPVAVVFTSWSSSRQCSGSSAGYTNADGTCYSLPGQSLRVDRITNTCRSEYNFFFFPSFFLVMIEN